LAAQPKSWPGPAFGELPRRADADLGACLTPAPRTGLICQYVGIAQAIAGSWQAEDAPHLLQHKALPSNTAKPKGSTPMDFIWISYGFHAALTGFRTEKTSCIWQDNS